MLVPGKHAEPLNWSRFDRTMAAGSWSVSGFLDFDLLLLLRHLCRLWQVDVQHALIKFRLDLGRVRIERQRYYSAKRAVAALYHMPILVLVLFVALGFFLTADGQLRAVGAPRLQPGASKAGVVSRRVLARMTTPYSAILCVRNE
jgi:hypothetical protein